MKSIRYMLTGKPGNLDDCLDFSRKNQSCSISVNQETYTSIREVFFVIQYVAKLIWRFDAGTKAHEIILYGETTWDGRPTRAGKEKANRKLEKILDQIRKEGVQVECMSGSFNMPASCKSGPGCPSFCNV